MLRFCQSARLSLASILPARWVEPDLDLPVRQVSAYKRSAPGGTTAEPASRSNSKFDRRVFERSQSIAGSTARTLGFAGLPTCLAVAIGLTSVGLSGCAAATDPSLARSDAVTSTENTTFGAHASAQSTNTVDVRDPMNAGSTALIDETPATRHTFRSAADDLPGSRWTVERGLFQRAERAIENSDHETWRAVRPFLGGYPLTPVLDAQALRRAVAGRSTPVTATTDTVVEFASRHPDLPQTANLLRESIEARHSAADWPAVERLATAFDFVISAGATLDSASDCRIRHARLMRGDPTALHDLEPLWLSARSLPNACDPLLDAWRQTGGLNEPLALARLKLAAAAGELRLAQFLLRDLTGTNRSTADAWIALAEQPSRLRDTPLRGTDAETAKFLVARGRAWLRADLDNALAFVDTDTGGVSRLELPLAERRALQAEAGVRLAVTQDARAARYIDSLIAQIRNERGAASPDAAMGFGDSVFEWRVRSALRDRDWRAVLAAIDAMSDDARATAQWAYWQGRAFAALGDNENAAAAWRRAAVSRDFHGILAAERLDQKPSLAPQPTPVRPAIEEALASDPAMSRMREYVALKRWADARREWSAAIERWSTEDRWAAARAFDAWGWHDRAIFTLARAQHWDDLDRRFPLAFSDAILAGAQTHGIDPAWAFAIARQESAFLHDVRSSAGALGIMQIMPATARSIAGPAGVTITGDASILDPVNNARMGTYYLGRNAERFGGHLVLASAAYNAGHGRVMSWLPGGSRALTDGPVEADIWAELVPFAETREYLRRVFSYKVIYADRLGQPLPRLSDILAPITAANDLAASMARHQRLRAAELGG